MDDDERRLIRRPVTFPSVDAMSVYRMYMRPYLQEFMDFVCTRFRVGIWTAATAEYAEFTARKVLIPCRAYDSPCQLPNRCARRSIWSILSVDDCDLAQSMFESHTMKPLEYVYWRYPETCSPENTVIIDDAAEVRAHNGPNAIRVRPFSVIRRDSDWDTELVSVMTQLETLDARFRATGSVLGPDPRPNPRSRRPRRVSASARSRRPGRLRGSPRAHNPIRNRGSDRDPRSRRSPHPVRMRRAIRSHSPARTRGSHR